MLADRSGPFTKPKDRGGPRRNRATLIHSRTPLRRASNGRASRFGLARQVKAFYTETCRLVWSPVDKLDDLQQAYAYIGICQNTYPFAPSCAMSTFYANVPDGPQGVKNPRQC
jgi:hypothetical protein